MLPFTNNTIVDNFLQHIFKPFSDYSEIYRTILLINYFKLRKLNVR